MFLLIFQTIILLLVLGFSSTLIIQIITAIVTIKDNNFIQQVWLISFLYAILFFLIHLN